MTNADVVASAPQESKDMLNLVVETKSTEDTVFEVGYLGGWIYPANLGWLKISNLRSSPATSREALPGRIEDLWPWLAFP